MFPDGSMTGFIIIDAVNGHKYFSGVSASGGISESILDSISSNSLSYSSRLIYLPLRPNLRAAIITSFEYLLSSLINDAQNCC